MNPSAKVALDQAKLHTQNALATYGKQQPNNTLIQIKLAIDDLCRAYGELGGTDRNYWKYTKDKDDEVHTDTDTDSRRSHW